jgi:nucleotide-binding universal stress UspA family protein
MKKILVPTDFSEIANKALDVAVTIARHNDATIQLLNVKLHSTPEISPYYSLHGGTHFGAESDWQQVLEDAKKEMDELIGKYVNVKIEPLIEETRTHLIKTVLKHDADFIVMGSNGAEGLRGFFVDSNSEEVVRLANCPVLVVKGETENFSPQTIVLAIDFTHVAFIKKAIEELSLIGAKFHLLHVDTGLKKIDYLQIREGMNKLCLNLGIYNAQFEIVNAPTIEQGIIKYIEKVNADLIVMYTHGRTGIQHFFKGSIAENIVNHVQIPVFTYVEH